MNKLEEIIKIFHEIFEERGELEDLEITYEWNSNKPNVMSIECEYSLTVPKEWVFHIFMINNSTNNKGE